MTDRQIATLLSIAGATCCTISWNEHRLYDDSADADDEWLDGEASRALEGDQRVTITVYPNTTVGFHAMSAASLPPLLDWLADEVDGGRIVLKHEGAP